MKYILKEHLESDDHEKRVWFWPFKWFTYPYALSRDEWDKYDGYIKQNYPAQYFIRETLKNRLFFLYVKAPLRKVKYTIKYTLRNPKKEMRDSVFPKQWVDLTETIVTFHLESILEFVDREKALECKYYSGSEETKRFEKELRECYEYAKNGRKVLEDKLTKAYENIPDEGTFEEVYKEVNEIEAHIDECDTMVCKWVIENRKHLWV